MILNPDKIEKTVYFLGAGATKALDENIPLNEDIVKKTIEEFNFNPDIKNLKDFVHAVFCQRKDPPIDNYLWHFLDYLIQENKSTAGAYSLEEIKDFRRTLIKFVILKLKKCLEHVDTESYRKFVMAIKDSQPSIISTNYDIVIDNALSDIRSFHYGFSIRYPVVSREISINGFKRVYKSGEECINTGNIFLLKLHGSLNWLYCGKCDEVDLTVKEKGAADVFTELYCCNENCTNKYESLLITPTMFKNYENRVIKEIWTIAEQKLIEADNLIFIGYGLSDEDYQIRCLLMKAMLVRGSPYKKVTVVSRPKDKDRNDGKYLEDNIEKKYQSLYGEVDFRPIGFQEFVDKMGRNN